MGGGRKNRSGSNLEEARVASVIDDLRAFQEFREEILPKIRAMLKAKKTSAEIREFAQSYLTARQVTIALTSNDEGQALRAIDSLTHQNEGKPTERAEVEHKFGKLKDEELRALVASRLSERASEEDENHESH